MKLKYLNDKVIKKVLSYESEETRNYIARIISHTTNIPYECLKDNLIPVHPEFGSNANIINSTGDLPFFDQKRYFAIEINYSRSSTMKVKGITYAYQLSLRQLANSEEYKNIKPVTIININARDIHGFGELVYEIGLMIKKYNVEYTDVIKIYDVNLSYFKNIDYNTIKEGLLKDLALFVIEDKEVLNQIYEGDRVVKMVKKNLDNVLKDFDEMFYCSEEELQRQIDEEMKEEIFNEGLKQEKRNIAKTMLNMKNITLEQIMEATQLSLEEINKIKKDVA